ncbi:patatin-like phospholipase family protein [Enemella evansiae]|uniref:Esterase n=1 Tax=Enemella evansiae TaxID=2016499 RepID=A0A255GE37_9ACTN|nr:patatin-like phospholipase family protein [Enemella evansiae]PFG65332.1 NTE family protein [Propionibacteriaceae bacterium ES.041]OYN97432.1 esterase [Enemella evansiae]OYN98484.1 esterase [Enemella evansiae]OYN99851.1 esterase [Enemella evansiae]OYO11182.1 esterase [Enemella evansiae]
MRVALALGSGGARGYAHIGVIAELHERGHEVVSVAGTSMGALVGGLQAAGRLEPFTEWATGLTQRDVWRLLDPALTGPGVIKAERVIARVSQILDGARIEQLPIPFTAVATDLDSRREVWFQRGPLDAAIRASIAIPSFITPVVINGRTLVDGGLVNPVPIDATFGSVADFTVAVNLAGLPGATHGPPVRESSQPEPGAPWFERIRRGFGHLDMDWLRARGAERGDQAALPTAAEEVVDKAAQTAQAVAEVDPDLVFGALPRGLKTTDVIVQSLDAMQAMITRYRMAANPPDVQITIAADAAGTLDFHRASEMIALGREKAKQALDVTDY